MFSELVDLVKKTFQISQQSIDCDSHNPISIYNPSTTRNTTALTRRQPVSAVLVRLKRKFENDLLDDAKENEDNCYVCMQRRASVRALPCGHRVVCRRCALHLIEEAIKDCHSRLNCILCRREVVRLQYSRPLRCVQVKVHLSAPVCFVHLQPDGSSPKQFQLDAIAGLENTKRLPFACGSCTRNSITHRTFPSSSKRSTDNVLCACQNASYSVFR